MTPATLRKTLMAVAVSSVSMSSFAEVLSLNSGRIDEDGTYHNEAVTISGTYNGGDYDAIQLNGATFNAGLTVDATIKVDRGQDDTVFDNADGLDIGRGVVISPGAASEINGDLLIKGTIDVQRLAASAVNLSGVYVENDVINQATLIAKGEVLDGDSARGLQLREGARAFGNLHNVGAIVAEGADAMGIAVINAAVDYSMVNEGSIAVKGSNAAGIEVLTLGSDEPTFGKAYVSDIYNEGTITATGVSADGVRVTNVILDSINNSGTIQAEGTAIQVNSFERTPESIAQGKTKLFLEQSRGLISGGTAAIQGNGLGVNLLWTGGKIQGDILGLGGYVRVYGNGVFDGSRIEATNTVQVGSTASSETVIGYLQLDRAQTTINGDLTIAGNSSVALTLSSATNPTAAVLSVTGTAQFDSGSQLRLLAKGSDFTDNGTSYKLLEAGNIINNGLFVTSSSSLLNVDTYQVAGNQVVAQVTAKNTEQVRSVINSAGGSGNAQAAGSAFSGLVFDQLAQSSPNDPVRQAFIAASENPAELVKLAEQLAPEVNGGASSAAVTGQGLISGVTSNRTSSGRQGLSSGDALKDAGVWVQTLYSDADQGLRDGIAGYNAYSHGVAVGADGKVSDGLTLGVAYSYLSTDVNGTTGNKTQVDGHNFTFYSGYELGNYFLDGSLTYGFNDNSSKRQIASTTAKGDYDSRLLGVNLEGGYTFTITPQVAIEPRLAARYSQVSIDSYREKGSSAALKIDKQRYEVGELGAGVRAVGNFPLGQGTLEPQAKLMAFHDFIADQTSSTSTFVLGGAPFATSGASSARDSYEAGVGADYKLGAVTVGLNYDYIGKSDFNADVFTAKVRYDF